jgi:type I restriction enzyme, S subunit
MASEWRPSNWGDEVTLEYGKAIRGYSPTQGKYRVFGSNGPIGWTSEALAQGPGVILGRKGAYRGVEYWRDPFWVIDTAYYLVPKTELDMRWLYYAVKHYKLGDVDDGSPVPSTTRAAVYMLELDVPPKPEQRAIARILGTLDDKIELNRRRNQTLEAMARALFKDCFVDFGPVRAKMEGREPYLPAELWQRIPDRFDNEGKPDGWEIGTLADYSSLNPESWSTNNAPDEIEYVDLANTKHGTIETTARIPWADAPSRAQRILRTGDTIVGTVRPANGSYALIDADGLTGSTGFAVLRPSKHIFRDFVFLAATSPENIERLSHVADGAAYPAVRPDIVLASPAPKPDPISLDGILKDFSDSVGDWIDSIEHNKRESRTLSQLRDTLLPKLISGDLRIAEAERFLARGGALDRMEVTAT